MPNKNNSPARVPACHPERPHIAKGLCKPCYDADYQQRNRLANNAKALEWSRKNPSRRAAHRRKYLYGIDDATVQARLRAQDGICKICMSAPATHLDHNHGTGKPRSLLCAKCNQGLGLFKENREALLRAVAYLELWDDRAVQVIPNTGEPVQ